jgi:SAM-dependent methyltransferase
MSRITGCRSCGNADLFPVLDLGEMPLADRFLTEQTLREHEPRYPLEAVLCEACGLVQITETVDPKVLFADRYPYYSSVSEALLKHSRENVKEVMASRQLNGQSLVVELASNDGYLLRNYVEHGIPVLGIDPAEGPAAEAEKVGVRTLNAFFTEGLADELRSEGLQADVIHANNVLAHVADTNGFVAGIATLMKDTGVAVIEAPYLRDLIDHCEFDTIYHEHLCYFSVSALDQLFKRHGLFLNDVQRIPIHGGSLRLFVEKSERRSGGVLALLEEEAAVGLTSRDYFVGFRERVDHLRTELLALVDGLRRDGARVAGYGAAAKGSTLVNFMELGSERLAYVVDRNRHKQGCYLPGCHQRIYDPGKLLEDRPEYVVILPWNFADEILAQQAEYRKAGGRFIIPIPEPHIV